MTVRAAKQHIAFGSTEPFSQPAVGFVKHRLSILSGATVTSGAITIDHTFDDVSIDAIMVDNALGTNLALSYQALVSSEGMIGGGEYFNAVWAPAVSIVAAQVVPVGIYVLTPPRTQAIRILATNNGADASAASPSSSLSLGIGLHVRVTTYS